MAESGMQDRLMPFLLDRLTDDAPTVKAEGRERRTFSNADMRRALLRDLSWLLNTSAQPGIGTLDEYPRVAASVLNYGIPDFSGRTASSETPEMIQRMVRAAILNYEPRIRPGSLRIQAIDVIEEGAAHVVALEIRAEFYDVPIPQHLFLRTEVDLETRHVELKVV